MTQDTPPNGQSTQAIATVDAADRARHLAYREQIGQDDASPRAIVPRTFAEAQSFAGAIATSSLIPQALSNRAPDILMIVLAGAELEIPPVRALGLFHVIEGVPKLSADGIAARCMASPLCEYLEAIEQSDERVTWRAKRRGRPELVLTWTIAQAVNAGLVRATRSGAPGNWQKFPRQMLNARCKADLCRLVWPDVCAGLMSAEEAYDHVAGPQTGMDFQAAPATQDRQGPPPGVPLAPPASSTPAAKSTAKATTSKKAPPVIDTTATDTRGDSPSSAPSATTSEHANGGALNSDQRDATRSPTSSSSAPSATASSQAPAADTASDASVSNTPAASQPSVPAEAESGFGDDEEEGDEEAPTLTIERFEREITAATLLAKPAAAAELARLKTSWLPWSKDETPQGGKQHAQRMRQVFAGAQKAIEAK